MKTLILLLGFVGINSWAANQVPHRNLPKLAACPASYGGQHAKGRPDLSDLLASGDVSASKLKQMLEDFGGGAAAEEQHFRNCILKVVTPEIQQAVEKKKMSAEDAEEYRKRLKAIMDTLNGPEGRRQMGLPPPAPGAPIGGGSTDDQTPAQE